MDKKILKDLRFSNVNSWTDVIWEALEKHEFPDHEWNEIATAMGWIEDNLKNLEY